MSDDTEFARSIAELSGVLNKLDVLCQSKNYSSTPTLLIHPPSARLEHAQSLADNVDKVNSRRTQMLQVTTLFAKVQNRLREQFSLYASAASPVSALPTELLQKIFHIYIFEYRNTAHRLSLVSRQWRQALLSWPLLWTVVRVPASALPYIRPEALHFAERPFHLHIEETALEEGTSKFFQEHLQSATISSRSAIQVLRTLMGDVGSLFEPSRTYRYDSLLDLHVTVIREGNGTGSSRVKMPPNTFPQLQTMTLDGCFLAVNSSLENLARVTLLGTDLLEDDFIHLLKFCPRLASISFLTVFCWQSCPEGQTALLPQLETLVISKFATVECIEGVLSYMTAPALKSFTYIGDRHHIFPDERDQLTMLLKDFVSRTGRFLSIHESDAIILQLSQSHSLEHLTLRATPDSLESVWRILTPDVKDPYAWPLPLLKGVELSYAEGSIPSEYTAYAFSHHMSRAQVLRSSLHAMYGKRVGAVGKLTQLTIPVCLGMYRNSPDEISLLHCPCRPPHPPRSPFLDFPTSKASNECSSNLPLEYFPLQFPPITFADLPTRSPQPLSTLSTLPETSHQPQAMRSTDSQPEV